VKKVPVQDVRAVIEVGSKSRSLAITIPRGWAEFWSMKKGSRIPVFYDSILVVLPPNHPKRKELEKRIRQFLIELK